MRVSLIEAFAYELLKRCIIVNVGEEQTLQRHYCSLMRNKPENKLFFSLSKGESQSSPVFLN